MESMLRLEDRQIAIMGGLMEESIDHANNGVPGLSSIPLVGEVFKNRNETTKKSELVVFLRPTIIRESRLDGDFRDTGLRLPEKDFFATPENSANEGKQP
jgi:general secretion pathway protein D